jgi:hypothetical protein
MNKTSSKLAASVRKVKAQQDSPATKTVAPKAAAPAPKPVPVPAPSDRVWPD